MTTGTTETGTYYFYNKKEQDIPIVFIHGVGLTYEIWQPQLEFFKNYSTLSYDILGHGKSRLNKDNITFDDLAETIQHFIVHLDNRRKVIEWLNIVIFKNNFICLVKIFQFNFVYKLVSVNVSA